MVCTLLSRGFRHVRVFRDFCESSTQLLVCGCLSYLRRFRYFVFLLKGDPRANHRFGKPNIICDWAVLGPHRDWLRSLQKRKAIQFDNLAIPTRLRLRLGERLRQQEHRKSMRIASSK